MTPGDVDAFLRPSATFFLSAIAISQMLHSPHMCLAVRLCHLLEYSIRFGYITCHWICFPIIVFYRSGIYSPLFTLSSTMPSILHIVHDPSLGCDAHSSISASTLLPSLYSQLGRSEAPCIDLAFISNNHSVGQKHPRGPVVFDGSDGTLHAQMERYMLTIPYVPPILCAQNMVTYKHHQNDTCVTLYPRVAVRL
jgi:hypothetical protein